MITEQQFLILFDIAKKAMNQTGGFAGYSNETIMQLINDIIAQQDNKKVLPFLLEEKEESIIDSEVNNTEPSKKPKDFWE